jgi:hypothetical protein
MASQPPSFKQTGRNLKLARDTELSHRFVPEFVRFGGILIPCPNDDVTFNLGRLASPAKCSVVFDEIVGVETAHGTPRPLLIDFLKCLIGCGVPECAGPAMMARILASSIGDWLLCRLQFVYFGVEILLGPPKLIAVAMAASGNSLREAVDLECHVEALGTSNPLACPARSYQNIVICLRARGKEPVREAQMISSRETPISLRTSSGSRLNWSVAHHMALRSARRRDHLRNEPTAARRLDIIELPFILCVTAIAPERISGRSARSQGRSPIAVDGLDLLERSRLAGRGRPRATHIVQFGSVARNDERAKR